MDSDSHLVDDLSDRVFSSHDMKPEAADTFNAGLWLTFKKTGLDRLLSMDDGLGLRASVSVLRKAGHTTARIPAAESMLANLLAASGGWEEESFMPTVIAGGEIWSSVPWGRMATAVYFLRGGRIARCRGPLPMVREHSNLAGEPRDELQIPRASIEESDSAFDPRRLICLSALLRAAAMVGAMESALELALQHAQERVQFGKPIGRFQAVQQMLAQLAAHTAAAGAAVDLAAGQFSPLTAGAAKARASEAARLVTDMAHQVIGAMGYTAEHPLHLRSKRLWAWRDEDGSEVFWNRKIGVEIAANGSSGLWPLLSGTVIS